MTTISREHATTVRDAITDDLLSKTEGDSVQEDEQGNAFIVLYTEEEMPNGTFPEEIDGVSIKTQVIGKMSP